MNKDEILESLDLFTYGVIFVSLLLSWIGKNYHLFYLNNIKLNQ